ncbi:hypothetical protein [Actinomadura macra]|nr:hypothetical protein [Actinomadura macra]
MYPPDATLGGDLRRGFRIFLRFPDGGQLDPAFAQANGCRIQYTALQ